jgi:hypothetical protein
VLLVSLVLFVTLAQGVRAGHLSAVSGERELAFSGAEAVLGIALPDALIFAGSDSLFIDGLAAERGRDYVIDYATGQLALSVAVSESALIILRYRYYPIPAHGVYRRSVIDSSAQLPDLFLRAGGTPDSGAAYAARQPDADGGGPGEMVVAATGGGSAAGTRSTSLKVGGAKTFGITVGSDRDLRLEQSLRLNISGRITRDVSVTAYLSDQNTPLIPEGDTEELRSLDKVLVEIEGERVAATMGDYILEIDGGSLLDVRRDLSGVTVSGEVGRAAIVLAGARADGEYASLTFRGTAGKQGPYLLTDRGGATRITVVAGSERIWLDGERLRRGKDNDYTIEYTAGEIEFTERRHITSDSEIVIDYEYATSDYDRDIYGGRATFTAGDGEFVIGAGFFRESDDRGDAASATLTEGQIAVLEAAGDDIELAHDDGIDSLGIGNGDYTLTQEGYFEYAGADSGVYDLSFERSSGGGYGFDYLGGFYYYVGENEGEFRLGKALPMPQDKAVAALDGRWEFGRDGFVSAEAAVSSFDRNTFSDLDDDDNLGNASVLRASTPGVRIGFLGGAEATVGFVGRRVGGSFEGVGRFRDVRYEETWELKGLDLPEAEVLGEGELALSLPGGGAIELSRGLLKRADALESNRMEFSMLASPLENGSVWAGGCFVDLRHRVSADSSLRREREFYRAGASYAFGPVRPGLSYRHDSRVEDNDGERYVEHGASIESSGSGEIGFRVAANYRDTERTSDGKTWAGSSTTRTEEMSAQLRRWEALTVEGNVMRRRTDVAEGLAESGTRYDLAAITLGHRSMSGALKGELKYSVTATEVEEKERFVTEEDGVEVTRIVSTGNFLPVTELSVGTRWSLRFGSSRRDERWTPDPSALRRFLTGLSLESSLKLRESTTTSDKTRLYLLDPSVLRGEDTVTGELTGRHVVRYATSGVLSARLAVKTRDRLDRVYTNSPEELKERSGALELKVSPPGGIAYRVQVDAAVRAREAGGSLNDYDLDERCVLAEVGKRQLGGAEIKLTALYGVESDAVSGVDVGVWQITPTLIYRLKGRGAVSASLTRTGVEASGGALPDYMADGRQAGASAEWRLSGDYRFNRFLTGTVTYSGERRPDADARHTVDMRLNAFF